MFNYVQSIAPSLEVMAFAGNKLPLGLTLLTHEFFLFPANPSQAGDDSHPNLFFINAHWRTNPYLTIRRVNTHIEILDILAHHLNGNTTDINITFISNHLG